jgi:hypothetical protein
MYHKCIEVSNRLKLFFEKTAQVPCMHPVPESSGARLPLKLVGDIQYLFAGKHNDDFNPDFKESSVRPGNVWQGQDPHRKPLRGQNMNL